MNNSYLDGSFPYYQNGCTIGMQEKLFSIMSDIDLICIREKRLCINNDHVPFLQDHIPVRDQKFFPAPYKDNNRLPGDIQIADTVPDPGIVLLKNDLFQFNVFICIEGFGAEHHGVVRAQDRIPAGN